MVTIKKADFERPRRRHPDYIVRKPFELFIGFTGCGYTYCNKAVAPGEDYKKLAFVDAYTGEITWYVAPKRIPGNVLLRIENDSERRKSE